MFRAAADALALRLEVALQLLGFAHELGVELVLPRDVVVASKFGADACCNATPASRSTIIVC